MFAFVLHIGGKVNKSSLVCTIALLLMVNSKKIAIDLILFYMLITSCRDSGWGSYVHSLFKCVL